MKYKICLGLACAAALFAQPQGQFAPLPDVQLWYVDTGGKGPPVVLLHAATGTSASWEKQIGPFAQAGFRVIAFDRRGWGRSGAGAGTAADDLAQLMDYLKIDRFHLIGTAAGGFVAIDFALSFPGRLRSLVLTHTIGGMTDEDSVELGRRLRPPAFNALPAELREVGPAYRARDKEGTEKWITLERASRPAGATPPQAMKNQLTLASLEKISTATLLISGGADMYAPPAVMQEMARHIRNSRFVNLPDAGHSGYWEAPEQYNREILQFIRKH